MQNENIDSAESGGTPAAPTKPTLASRVAQLRTKLERIADRLYLDRVTDRHILIAAGLSVFLCLVTWQRCGLRGCPNVHRLTAYQPDGATVLLDRYGQRYANLTPVHHRIVPIASLPKHVPDAFIAVEDKRFYQHNGVDWLRVAGASIHNLKAGAALQGSSTITMQLTRNLFPKQVPAKQRTLRRKLLEVRVARAIERAFEKDEVLELYLNHIYFGNGAYGIEAAAQEYFRKPAKELTLAQAAMLAALPKAPANYDPRRRATRAKERRDLVLTLMEQQGRITPNEATPAMKSPLTVQARSRRGAQDDGFAPYFVDVVQRMLEDRFGDLIYERRLRVHTTLDIKAQRAAEEEMMKQLRAIEGGTYGRVNGPRYVSASQSDDLGTRYLQGAAVVMEVTTGNVIALVGGRDFLDSPFNRATQSRRQVGSAFKPFVYATAVAQGYPPSQHILDEPLSIQVSRQVSWEPRNFDGQYYGEVSMRQALTESRNIPTVRIAREIGLDSVRATARRAGLTGEMPIHPSMPLGTVASSPLEMARAYTVFPGLGTRPDPRFVASVIDEKGAILWQPAAKSETGEMDPRVAYIMTDMMRDVVDHGTGAAVRSAGFYNAAAGKTGTTNEGSDAWFVGYTPDLVGSIWVGFDQRRSIVYNAQGGRLAAPVWGRIMKRVYETRPNPGNFTQPTGVVRRDIDPESGLVLADGCYPRWGEPEHEIFLADHEPETTCPNTGGGWIGGLLRGIGDLFGHDKQPPSASQQRDPLDELLDEADRLHPQARKLLGDWIDENLRRGIPRESPELKRMAEKWIEDLRKRLDESKRTR